MNEPIISLLPYQRRWFEDDSRFKVGMFARQTGKTFTCCLELVDDCFKAESEGLRTRWVILSRGERQAKEAMDTAVKPFIKAYYELFKAVMKGQVEYQEYVWKGSEAQYNAMEVTFPGGSRITALPANPDTARGFSANVLLDEFAFHADSRAIWTALFPVISKPDLKLRVVSTPNGKGNKFYDLISQENSQWSRHQVDIHQAVADGLPRNIEEMEEALGDEDAWDQEFRLKFLDEASAWLSFDLINSVEHKDAGNRDLYGGGVCFVGVDIAVKNDLFVVWVFEQVGDVLWTREIVARRRITFAEQDTLLDEVMEFYKVGRLCIDQTGMGEKPVEDAKRRYGEHRVEGIMFTSSSKLMLANTGKERFQDRTIRIPLGDQALRADLHKLRKIGVEGGAPRFVASSDSAGHADRTWACFMAAYAAQTPEQLIEYFTTDTARPSLDTAGYGMDGMDKLYIDMECGFGVVGSERNLTGF